MTDSSNTTSTAPRKTVFKVGLAVITLALLALIAEGVSRFAYPLDANQETRLAAFRDYAVHKRHRIYDPHPYIGYTPRNWHERFRSQFSLEKKPGVLRIACLGGSTTEGNEAWPHLLAKDLADRANQPVEVMNWGVSGWTTTESMLNFFVNVQDWEPDLVLIHHAANDVLARLHPNYRTDYSHFRHPWVELNLPGWKRWLLGTSHLYARLQMEGVQTNIQSRVGYPMRDRSIVMSGELPPETSAAYQRNLKTLIEYSASSGAKTALLTMPYSPNPEFRTGVLFAINHKGTLEHNELARELAAETDCLLIDLAAGFEAIRARSARFFRDGVHLDPGGHELKAELVAEALFEAGLLTKN